MAYLVLHLPPLIAHRALGVCFNASKTICPSPPFKSYIIRAQSTENPDRPRKSDGGQSLWRNDLRQQRSGVDFSDASPSWSDESFLDLSVEQDIERLARTGNAEKRFSTSPSNVDEKREEKGLFARLLETLLVADFFFILFILGWLLAGLAEKAAFDTHLLIDVWLPFWPTLFQPALGFFMAGALWTALSKFMFKR